MKETCRSCTRVIDSNDVTAGGLFGTCTECLKEKQAAKLRAANFPRHVVQLPPPDPENPISAMLSMIPPAQMTGFQIKPELKKRYSVAKIRHDYYSTVRVLDFVPEAPNPLGRDEDFYIPLVEAQDDFPVSTQEDIDYMVAKMWKAMGIPEKYWKR